MYGLWHIGQLKSALARLESSVNSRGMVFVVRKLPIWKSGVRFGISVLLALLNGESFLRSAGIGGSGCSAISAREWYTLSPT